MLKSADLPPAISQPFKSVDHEHIVATRILSQRNPPSLGFAMLFAGDGNREWV